MERIKRALELARQERERAARTETAGTPPVNNLYTSAVVDDASADPAARGGGDPVARSLPKVDDGEHTVTVSDNVLRAGKLLLPGMVGEAAHGFRLLRTQVMQRMQQRGWNTLAILSPGPDEGKTFTAINLAMAIAAQRDSISILVDLDLRFPRVYRRLGFIPVVGIEDCLRGEAKVSDALVAVDGYPGLMVLPARGPVEHSSELISSAAAGSLFREVKGRYPNGIVLYDLPPVLATDDALSFVPQVDAALLVVGEGRTRREDLMRCLELLRDTPILGTVLNGSRRERSAEYAY